MPKRIAGIKVGRKLNAAEVARIQAAQPGISMAALEEEAANKNIKIKKDVQGIFDTAAEKAASDKKQKEKERQQAIIDDLEKRLDRFPLGPVDAREGEEIVNYANFDLAREGANLQTQKEIERIRNDGATERLKYEVDNRIPLVEAEAEGKIDLQAIVNAGYKNIANIERGTEMVRNITSMFSF